MTATTPAGSLRRRRGAPWLPSARGIRWGLVASAGLLLFYATVIVVAQGVAHLRYQVGLDWPWVTAIVAGFGIQVSLLITLRERRRARAAAAAAGTGAGASVVGMLACCAHHLAEIAPIVGVNLVTTFLASYRVAIMAAGILINTVAIVITVRRLNELDAHPLPGDAHCHS